jgi:toxin ParE1/3/4
VRVNWLAAALHNLEEQADFIAENNLESGQKMLTEIASAVNQLARFPSLGRAGRVDGTRELIVPPYIVVYRVRNGTIEVLRLLHGAQRWPHSF